MKTPQVEALPGMTPLGLRPKVKPYTPEEIIAQNRATSVQSAKRLLEIERLENINAELLAALENGMNGGWLKSAHWEAAKLAIAKAKAE